MIHDPTVDEKYVKLQLLATPNNVCHVIVLRLDSTRRAPRQMSAGVVFSSSLIDTLYSSSEESLFFLYALPNLLIMISENESYLPSSLVDTLYLLEFIA